MQNQTHILTLIKKVMIKILNSKLAILLEYQIMKIFLVKVCIPNWSEEVFVIKRTKNTVLWTYVINDIYGEEIVVTFFKNQLLQKQLKKFRLEKFIKRNRDKLYVRWKGHNNLFNSWIDKKDIVKMVESFPKLKFLGKNAKVELELIMQQKQI